MRIARRHRQSQALVPHARRGPSRGRRPDHRTHPRLRSRAPVGDTVTRAPKAPDAPSGRPGGARVEPVRLARRRATWLTAEVAAADIILRLADLQGRLHRNAQGLPGPLRHGLAGAVAVPVMTGGWPGHLLAVEVHLRPVLVELGATVPGPRPLRHRVRVRELDAAVAKSAETAVPFIRRARVPGKLARRAKPRPHRPHNRGTWSRRQRGQ